MLEQRIKAKYKCFKSNLVTIKTQYECLTSYDSLFINRNFSTFFQKK